jgi:putative ABC transport system permease protein
VCLRALPLTKPQDLVVVRISDPANARGSFDTYRPALTDPLWEQIRDHQEALSGVLAWSDNVLNRAPEGESQYVDALEVSGDFFNVLGIKPALGRLFNPDDDRKGLGSSAAVISYAFWQQEFGGSRDVLDKTLLLNNHPFPIVGVTPSSFFGLEVGGSFDVAVPICAEAVLAGNASRLDKGMQWWLTVMGRMNEGWSLDKTNASLASISPGIFGATLPGGYPDADVQHYLDFKLAAAPAPNGFSELRESYTTPLWLLLALAGLILLVACDNLANLVLARTGARKMETAVRLALGASRGRLISQLMTESLLLACIGAVLGLFLARGLTQFLMSFLGEGGYSLFLNLSQDWRVLGFMAGLAVLTCLLVGLSPALLATRANLGKALKAGGGGLTADRKLLRFGRGLLVAQVGVSLILVTGALLFVRSLRNLETFDPGFRRKGVLITNIGLRRLNLPSKRLVTFKRDLVEGIAALPGVDAAADTDIVPLTSPDSTRAWMDGSQPEEGINLEYGQVGPDYFKALGIPLLAGRTFDQQDSLSSPRVAIVNRMFCRQMTGGSDPIGRRFWLDATASDRATAYLIVGVVENARQDNLDDRLTPLAFFASSQDRHPEPKDQILVRSGAPPAAIISSVKTALAEANPDITINFEMLETEIRNSMQRERLMATLSGFFGLLALLLSCVGLYGVMSYNVVARTSEIGIRMALGATPGGVLWLIVRESLLLASAGVVVAIPELLIGTRYVSGLLFRLRPADPISIAIAALTMFLVAAAAAFIPARRASHVDPMAALRSE